MAREAARLLGNAGNVGPAIRAAPASAAGVKTVGTIVVGTIAATRSDFQALKQSVPKDPSNVEYAYDSIKIYLCLAKINDCEVQRLRKEPKVLAAYLDREVEQYKQPFMKQVQNAHKRK
ncbi:hypothetical protein TWF506_011189 [Arthrobotrys conoides]|uniref:Uncharacterized protein n=1 Tax=Arthrobotrys conoides TaxID=74498 RepID=A0AAN8NA92_9PEZI